MLTNKLATFKLAPSPQRIYSDKEVSTIPLSKDEEFYPVYDKQGTRWWLLRLRYQ